MKIFFARWVSDHLPWIVVALLVLWAPPVLFTVAVDLHVVPASSGYPGWHDPVLLLPIVELSLMAIAVPALLRHRREGWLMLVWSRVAVAAQAAWTLLLIGRLEGFWVALTQRATIEALAGLLVAAGVLVTIRPFYDGGSVVAR